jgi:hypothetical protein
MAHSRIADVAVHLADAKAAYDYKKQQARRALKSVIGDGTGSAEDLAAAQAVAKAHGFELELYPAIPIADKGKSKSKATE